MLRHLTLKQAAFLLTFLLLALGGILVGSLRYVGRDLAEIERSWTEFQIEQSEKARIETGLRAILGYGGLVHNYKNYILRKDDDRKYRTFEAIGVARGLISQYETLGVSPAEDAALQDVDRTVVAYAMALDDVDHLIQEGRTAREIDARTHVDDGLALRGLDTLHAEILAGRGEGPPKASKAMLAARLRAALGYGGMIHNFKDYVLRGDLEYAERAQIKMQDVHRVISEYRLAGPSPGERVAIEDIEEMLENYQRNLGVAGDMNVAGSAAETIDAAVKVDDTLALRGLATLDRETALDISRRSDAITSAVRKARSFERLAGWGVVAVIALWGGFSLFLIHGSVVLPVRGLTSVMKRLAGGDLEGEVPHVSLRNEIGELARAVRVFKRTSAELRAAERQLQDTHEEYNAQLSDLQAMKERSENQAAKAVNLAENLAVAREAAEKASARAEADELRIRTIVDTATDAIITVDAKGNIETFNSAAQTIFGWQAGEAIGRNISFLIPGRHQAKHDEYMTGYHQGKPSGIVGRVRELEGLRRDGSVFPIELSVNAMRLAGELKFTGVIRDITERKQAEEHIRLLAMTDPLTGLANRHQFLNRFQDALSLARRNRDWRLAVLMLDLDRFKPVNDAYGHPVGDALLKEVGRQLREQTRETDTVARLGGDEFAVILLDAGDREMVGQIADRIAGALSAPLAILGNRIQIGTSLGVAFYPEDGDNADDLMRKADLALYAAKKAGRSTWRYYEPSMKPTNVVPIESKPKQAQRRAARSRDND